MKFFIFSLLLSLGLFGTLNAETISSIKINISPAKILQGEPLQIEINSPKENISSIYFGKTKLGMYSFGQNTRALYGVDLALPAKKYVVKVEMKSGSVATTSVEIVAREKLEETFSIPEKLGGNTPASATKLVTTLRSENDLLNNLFTQPKNLWKTSFRYPLATTTVTDTYGYIRKTGYYQIPHKGTDFRATVGTPVYAMNRGVVRLLHKFRNYGNTIVIDHGLGVQTLYLHLDKVLVYEGKLVEKGDLIARSGMTGYAESPHLHLSTRINGVSVDPLKFLDLLGDK